MDDTPKHEFVFLNKIGDDGVILHVYHNTQVSLNGSPKHGRRRVLRCRYCDSLRVIGICEDCRDPFCRRHGAVLPEVAICFTCVHDNYDEQMKVK